MLQKTLLLCFVLFFVACGYKPSAKYARNVLGQKVSTFVTISKEDPENSVLIKDAVDTAIIDVFHASLTDKAHSDSHLHIEVANPSYSPVQYDENGFIVAYRMKISLKITQYSHGKSNHYQTDGFYDFAVTPNAVITDQQRFDAIRNAANKAIVSFVAKISVEGIKG